MPSRDRILVVDPKALRGLVEPFVQAAGGQRAAARESGVSQTHLSRILNATAPYQLSESVLLRLANWIPPKYRKRLIDATISWHAQVRLERYARWLVQRTGEENTGLVGVSAEVPILEGALRHGRRRRL